MNATLKLNRVSPDKTIEFYDVVRDGDVWGIVLHDKRDNSWFASASKMVRFPGKHFKTDKAALKYVDSKTNKYHNLAKMSAKNIMNMEGKISLRKILEDIHVPLKKGDTVLVGKFKNHPIEVKKIGKGDDGMPTINDKPAVKFRLPKKEGKLAESPQVSTDRGQVDLHIEKYSLPPQEREKLIRAFESDSGVWGYSDKYDAVIIFKKTGVLHGPNGGTIITEPTVSAEPQTVSTDMPGQHNKLPANWEKFVEGEY